MTSERGPSDNNRSARFYRLTRAGRKQLEAETRAWEQTTAQINRELKKGAAELLLLSVLEARPRHGYELGKLIETRSGGRLVFHLDSLYPLLYRLEERGWIKGALGREAGRAPAPLLSAHTHRSACAVATA